MMDSQLFDELLDLIPDSENKKWDLPKLSEMRFWLQGAAAVIERLPDNLDLIRALDQVRKYFTAMETSVWLDTSLPLDNFCVIEFQGAVGVFQEEWELYHKFPHD
jgi:hypothetical protein